jgi:hypothetical protein
MAKHTYTIASEEGANRYGAEVGTTLEIDIPAEEAKAVVAAGWVDKVEEPAAAPAKSEKTTKEGK